MKVSRRGHRVVPVKQGGTADSLFVLGKAMSFVGDFFMQGFMQGFGWGGAFSHPAFWAHGSTGQRAGGKDDSPAKKGEKQWQER